MRRSQILLDCDPGLDDALAVLLALGSPERLDVKAIVATYGNVGLDRTKSNLLRILDFFAGTNDYLSLQIGSGSNGPLVGARHAVPLRRDAPEARVVHGNDGLGDLSEPFHLRGGPIGPPRRWPKVEDGIDLIINSALSNKINSIVATGPLTDLAKAVTRAPTLFKHLDEIIIMGGAVFVRGNVTPYAEFNFYCDPEAAGIVLNAPVKKRLVSLDVTHMTLLTTQRLKPLRAVKGSLAKFICGIADYSIRSNKRRGLSGAPMHDPLAAALAIDPDIGEYEGLCLDVETRGKTRGRVVVKKGRPNTLFCKSVNVDMFFKLFIGTLTKLANMSS